MADEQDLTTAVEAAWVGFRRRLADRLASLADDEDVVVRVEVEGAPSSIEFWASDDRATISADSSDDWSIDVSPDEVDRLAVLSVQVLREVYGVPHPVFLLADGLERDGDPTPNEPVADPAVDEDAVVLPGSHDELIGLVDAALAEMTDSGVVEHDPDGDVALRVGRSVVFVRVLEDRPGIEIFAEIAIDPDQPERLPVELDILNRTHETAKFAMHGTTVRMSYALVAWPFAPLQLRTVLRRFLDDVDEIAESLVQRIGGRRFLEWPEVEEAEQPEEPDRTPTHAGMVAVLELLHLGPVSSPTVATLFAHDRQAITRHLTGIRLGQVDCGDHHEEEVLTCLRRGLLHVVSGEVPERRPRPLPPRPRSEQASLVDDGDLGEDTLDLGRSA